MESAKTCKASQEKKDIITKIEKFGKEYPIIAVLNMEGLPASTLLKVKKQLKGKVELVMTRKTLLQRGLANLKLKGGDDVIGRLKGMPALMFTKENPFALYKIIKKSKQPAAAKPGQIAPKDLMIQKGPTPFTPGPVISEFAALGVKAGVEGGKVAVKEDKVVVKEGEVIKPNVASMLARLGVEPMEIGLDLTCVYEKGTIFDKKVLDVDEKQFMANLTGAAMGGLNLACEIGYTTPDTIILLITKAARNSRAVGIEANILAPEILGDVLAKAERIATQIKNQTNN
jgi:large subunit ribosomal protein L10